MNLFTKQKHIYRKQTYDYQILPNVSGSELLSDGNLSFSKFILYIFLVHVLLP